MSVVRWGRGRARLTRGTGLLALAALVVAPAVAASAPVLAASPRAVTLTAGTWKMQQIDAPPSSALFGVSCVSSNWCEAVGWILSSPEGGTKTALIYHWNGHRWTRQQAPAGNYGLSAVTCRSKTMCVAAGAATYYGKPAPGYKGHPTCPCSRPLIMRWNGHRWATQRVPNPSFEPYGGLNAVDCASKSTCFAVGFDYTGTVAERYTKGSWHLLSALNDKPGNLIDVTCWSASGCDVVGWGINLWNGRKWSKVSVPPDVPASEVTCSSLTLCEGVGTVDVSGGMDRMEGALWDGTNWTTQPFGSSSRYPEFNSIFCSTPGESCVAVGQASPGVVAARMTDGTWSTERIPLPHGAVNGGQLNSVDCTSDGTCFVVGRAYLKGDAYHLLIERSG